MKASRAAKIAVLLAMAAVGLAIFLAGDWLSRDEAGEAFVGRDTGGDGFDAPPVLVGRGAPRAEPAPTLETGAVTGVAPSPAPLRRYTLRGRLLGFRPLDGTGAVLHVVGLDRSWARPTPPVRTKSDGEGHFDVELGPLLQAHPDASEIEIRVDHPAYVPANARAEVRTPSSTHGVVHEIEIAVVSATVIEGRVEDEGGQPLEGVAVGLARWSGDRPVAASMAIAGTDAKGRFRLRTALTGRVLLLAAASRRLPSASTVEIVGGGVVEAPTLVLRLGAVIEGTLRFRDEPLEWAYVEAHVPPSRRETGEVLTLGREKFLWNAEHVERYHVNAPADEDGHYRLAGLAPTTYVVELSHGGQYFLSGPVQAASRRDVEAPARGVDFDLLGALLRFEMRANGPRGHLTWMLHTAGTTQPVNLGVPDTLLLIAKPGEHVRLWNDGGDYKPFSLEVEAPDAGESRTEEVVLERPDPRAEIVVRLADGNGAGIERAGFALYPNAKRTAYALHTWDLDGKDGSFRLTDALPGRALLVVRAGGSWRGGDAHYLEASQEVFVPDAGVLEVELSVAPGGRMRLRARAPDGAGLGPKCIIRNDRDQEMDVRFVARRANAYRVGDALAADGPTNVEPALPAGTYRLTLTTDGYAAKTVEVVVRVGETTTVDAVLDPQ